ncbi:MAG: glutathione binding-like protein, partial [Pseudomonadota bacterium]
ELHVFNSIGYAAQHTLPFFADKIEQIPLYADTQVRRAHKLWLWLDKELADGRPYIAGERFSVADITGLAALMVSAIMNAEIPSEAKNALSWQERVHARPSVMQQQSSVAA